MKDLRSVRIEPPATTANMGPGFDCLGMALSLRNSFTFTRIDGPDRVLLTGPEAEGIPTDSSNLAIQALRELARRVDDGSELTGGIALEAEIHIPRGRGLGSSATAIVAGALAASAFLNATGSHDWLARQVTDIEGHPDNVAPCLYGGLVLSLQTERLTVLKTEVKRPPKMALLVPSNIQTATDESRGALPDSLPRDAVVRQTARTAVLMAALAGGLEPAWMTPGLLEDELHEPVRGRAIPGFAELRALAVEAGAYGLVISGSGPSVLIFAPTDAAADQAAERCLARWRELGVEGRTLRPTIETEGARITRLA